MTIKNEKELIDIYRRLSVEKQSELKNFIEAKVRELEKEKELLYIYQKLPVEKRNEVKNFIEAKVRELEQEESKV